MKYVVTILMIGGILVLSAFTLPVRSDDSQLDKRHVKTVEVRNVTPRNGKNLSLDIAINPPPNIKLPSGISAVVNGRQVHLYDDGRWPDERAGDGVYSLAGSSKNGQPLTDKATLRLQSSSGSSEPIAVAPKFTCSISIVECPKDCKSSIFQTRCVVCLDVRNCELSF